MFCFLFQSAASVLYRFYHFHERDVRSVIPILDQHLYTYFGDAFCNLRCNLLENQKYFSKCRQDSLPLSDREEVVQRPSRMLKYMSTRYKPEAKRLTVESVFSVPKVRRKRNSRIMFKFAGAIPVPEVSLKRRRLDSRYSQFIAGKESEGHVVVVGKFWRKSRLQSISNVHKPTGSLFCIL